MKTIDIKYTISGNDIGMTVADVKHVDIVIEHVRKLKEHDVAIKYDGELDKGARANYINQLISETYDINLVTCGSCGEIFSHPIKHGDILKCPHCKMESDPCDFPDLFT